MRLRTLHIVIMGAVFDNREFKCSFLLQGTPILIHKNRYDTFASCYRAERVLRCSEAGRRTLFFVIQVRL